MPTEVHLSFEDDAHRDALVQRLKAHGPLPDGELVEDDDGARLVLDAEDSNTAIMRAEVLIMGALQGTDIDPSSVCKSVPEGWS